MSESKVAAPELWNPTRLDLALRYRGFDTYDLAVRLGLRVPGARRLRRGDIEPTSEQVAELSTWLHFPEPFFFGPTLDEPRLL